MWKHNIDSSTYINPYSTIQNVAGNILIFFSEKKKKKKKKKNYCAFDIFQKIVCFFLFVFFCLTLYKEVNLQTFVMI